MCIFVHFHFLGHCHHSVGAIGGEEVAEDDCVLVLSSPLHPVPSASPVRHVPAAVATSWLRLCYRHKWIQLWQSTTSLWNWEQQHLADSLIGEGQRVHSSAPCCSVHHTSWHCSRLPGATKDCRLLHPGIAMDVVLVPLLCTVCNGEWGEEPKLQGIASLACRNVKLVKQSVKHKHMS